MTGFNLGFTAIVLTTIEEKYGQGNPKYNSIVQKIISFTLIWMDELVLNMTGFDQNTTGIDWNITRLVIYI